MEIRTIKDRIECSGAIICAKDTSRILLLQKTEGKHAGRWVLPGGTNLENETAYQGLQRELVEELGHLPEFQKIIPLEKFVSNDLVFNFNTYFCIVDSEFCIELSDEHSGWGWFNINRLPKPTHQGLESSLKNKNTQLKIQTIIEILREQLI